MTDKNHVELDWAVQAIIVGARHRKDLGDLDTLAASIEEIGLLQPITITPDGVLICGARRLAAIKQLGWRTTNVWIRTGISNKLTSLMAERDGNVSQKSFTTAELAELYAELKQEIAVDAARRQQASRFVDGHNPLSDGGGNFPPPQTGTVGKTREQAAQMLGGQASYKTLEKVLAIKQVAASQDYSPELRQMATEALQQIETGAAVDPLFLTLRAKVQAEELHRIANDPNQVAKARDAARSGAVLLRKLDAEGDLSPQEMERAARAALQRVITTQRSNTPTPAPKPRPVEPVGPRKKTVKHFLWVWGEMASWPDDYDTEIIAAEVPDERWLAFKHTMTAGIDFMETVDALRATRSFAA